MFLSSRASTITKTLSNHKHITSTHTTEYTNILQFLFSTPSLCRITYTYTYTYAYTYTSYTYSNIYVCSYLIGVGGVGDVVGAHVAAEDRAENLVGQVVALRGVSQQVARDLCACIYFYDYEYECVYL